MRLETLTERVRGSRLGIDYRDTGEAEKIDVSPGLAGWDAPTDRVRRAVNLGTEVYEEVVTFYRADASIDPQPRPE